MNEILNSFLIDENTSIEELERSIPIIQKEIEKRKTKEIDKARAKVREFAKSLGVTIETLLEEPAQKVKKKVEPRYRSKIDTTKTWTGRGKQPRWFTEELDAGATLEDLLIKKDA